MYLSVIIWQGIQYNYIKPWFLQNWLRKQRANHCAVRQAKGLLEKRGYLGEQILDSLMRLGIDTTGFLYISSWNSI